MIKPHDLKPVERCCVADGVTTKKAVLPFRPLYLCATHHALWKQADADDRAREERKANLKQRVRDIQPDYEKR